MTVAQAAARPPAPELEVTGWLNTAAPLTLDGLRGRAVLLHAFQMLCPGCVLHGLPQTSAAFERFSPAGLVVIGMHTVFEHHDVMGRAALEAFVREYRLGFPIAIDRASTDTPVPVTMRRYRLQGTPSVVLIDRQGRIRLSHFGRLDDMLLGSIIGELLAEDLAVAVGPAVGPGLAVKSGNTCTSDGCAVDADR